MLVYPTFPPASEVSKFMEITDIFHESSLGNHENFGCTNISNNFYDSGNYGSGSGSFSKSMETVGYVGKTNCFYDSSAVESWELLLLPTLPTISNIPKTMAPAPEVSPNSWKLLAMLVKPTNSMISLWGIMQNDICNSFYYSENYGSRSRVFFES